MDAPSSTDISLFGRFRLDRRSGVLFRRDERGVFAPLAMGSRALDILGVLVERAGELVSRAEIIAAIWPETAVEDSNLNVQIAALRRILDERRTERSCIQTIPGRGYRFTAPVTRVAAEGRANAAAVPPSGAPTLPDKPSLAVLPFQNMSGDPEQEYFSPGSSHTASSHRACSLRSSANFSIWPAGTAAQGFDADDSGLLAQLVSPTAMRRPER
jgi:DNA-binding winged helix-turn-helix (wHTH) protein